MIITLSEHECRQLLPTTTVGRLGFVYQHRVQIIPVNYLLHDGDVVVRTSPDGVLSSLADGEGPVSFEVDFHDASRGAGWSVLMSGSVVAMAEEEASSIAGASRVVPWAGGSRPLHLRFSPATVSGRRVQRRRDDHADF
ncbi:pyridoxamine 5'-phosphate oxidase family protein [Microbacterium marinilacus]|uniref:Pyridoxamine 5'-phosphate oxidase family protein n=1 Tax=Microbacterium marinilacus TaxID=415209 RepID=A0ABP7B6T3_9MICO|nr:pyridoxamine 5'-phosphate oxidase family protein [Microbacterium marinilacus]MBY0687465.1 pyridoxamine 5'-phosphate oxidase family protein [Microbacterium marinilacus]